MKTILLIASILFMLSCASKPERTWSLETDYPNRDTIRCTFKNIPVYSIYHQDSLDIHDFYLFDKCLHQFIHPSELILQLNDFKPVTNKSKRI